MTVQFVHLLDELRRRSLRMAGLVEDIVQEACEAVLNVDEPLARRVVARDSDVDSEEVKVEHEVIRLLALYQPVGSDLRLLCTILKVNNDLERVADCAINMAERAKHLDSPTVRTHNREIRQLCTLGRQILRDAVAAYVAEDESAAWKVVTQDDTMDALYSQFIRVVIAAASREPESLASHLDILSVAKNLERIADHATNVAEDVIFLATGQIVRHQAPGKGG